MSIKRRLYYLYFVRQQDCVHSIFAILSSHDFLVLSIKPRDNSLISRHLLWADSIIYTFLLISSCASFSSSKYSSRPIFSSFTRDSRRLFSLSVPHLRPSAAMSMVDSPFRIISSLGFGLKNCYAFFHCYIWLISSPPNFYCSGVYSLALCINVQFLKDLLLKFRS
jgi:hypothetical protein